MDLELIKPYIVVLIPALWAILEGIKRAGVPTKWIPFLNAALSLLAGGGVALLERQDLIPAVSQVVILFLGAAGLHDRVEKLIKKPVVEKLDPVYYTQGSEDEG